MHISLINSFKSNKELIFLLILLVGYVVVSSLHSFFGIDSRIFAVPYRFLVFFFSFFILLEKIYYREWKSKILFIFSVFWFFYFFKTFYSFSLHCYLPEFLKQEYEIYLRIFIINLFPCLALLSLNYQKVNFKNLSIYLFWILFIMLTINLFYTILYLNNFNNISGIFAVYYISSGHFGASLVILSSYFLLFKSHSKSVLNNTILILGIFLGLFAIYISAARSPLLAIILVGLYFVILKNKIKYIYFFLFILILSIVLLFVSKESFALKVPLLKEIICGFLKEIPLLESPYL